jgi:pimeloyl-ACP methyl ester carboxylesterase
MRDEAFYRAPDGVRIWHAEVGRSDGPVLALCDGIACDGFIWPHLIDHFSDRFRILRWHYRGHGRSEAPEDDDGLRLERLVDDLRGILAKRGVERAVVAGHSMGVQVALEFYRRHSEATQALVLMCGAYGHPLSTFQRSDRGDRVLPVLRSLVERAPRLASALWRRLIPTELSFRIAQRVEIHPTRARREEFLPYLEHVARMDLRVFFGMLAHAAAHSAEDVLPAVAAPVLVVAGEHDGFTPPELAKAMAERVPDGELLLVPGGTHTAPIEFPEEIHGRLEAFLRRAGVLA